MINQADNLASVVKKMDAGRGFGSGEQRGLLKRTKKLAALCAAVALTQSAQAQQLSGLARDQARGMLQTIAADVQKHYYDPKFHGIDWQAKVREAREKIDGAPSLSMALANIAAALDALNDSHTYFVPPSRPFRHDYGWRMQMVGDRCYVTEVRPHSDAEAKGLRPGDELLAINGFTPTRENLWKIRYRFHILRPLSGLRLNVRDLEGREKQLDVMAQITPLKRTLDLDGSGATFDIWEIVREAEAAEHLMRARLSGVGDELMILKLPLFAFSEEEVHNWVSKARKYKTLIIDLRGNPGGSVDSLKNLLGGVFDHDIKVGDRVGRATTKPLVAKSKGRSVFTSNLGVLVDSESASASELFARIVQLEKRGKVLGDRSSGSVMEGRQFNYKMGTDIIFFYGALITDADIVMSDGKSLEHMGVTPDEVVLPTATDLAGRRDLVMARAAELFGVRLNAEQAGKLFPFEWPRQ